MKSKKIRLLLFGASGRMGTVIKNILSDPFDLKAEVDHQHETWKRANDVAGEIDIAIDFSQPEGFESALSWCVKNQIPLVSGTTGLAKSLDKAIAQAAKKIPLFMSPNMSLGLNLMAKAAKVFASEFSGTEVEIEEIHHRHKKDKPSGTAKFLHSVVEKSLKKGTELREPISMRGGGVFGIHKVYFFDESEWVCFEHQAMNRAVFARGALKAAQWLVGQKPGLYNMDDLL